MHFLPFAYYNPATLLITILLLEDFKRSICYAQSKGSYCSFQIEDLRRISSLVCIRKTISLQGKQKTLQDKGN